MFEALIVSLGDYKLLKIDDSGRVHPEGSYTAPDFRIVLTDGRQWLIEVKNFYEPDPFRQQLRLRKVDVEKLAAYAETVGCPLRFALYWARWRIWTLVPVAGFVSKGSKLIIDMEKAITLSEMGEIGDLKVGTKPPISLKFIADPANDSSISEAGEANFIIAGAKIFCDNKEITDPDEQAIAWIFMLYGDWREEVRPFVSGNALEAIDFVFAPQDPLNEGMGFEIIGTLSTMFARYYAEQTLDAGDVVRTESDIVPDWFRSLIDPGHISDALPLWRFIIKNASPRSLMRHYLGR